MTTKIPVELSSTPGIVDGSNATAITIDSSENVGIGTTSPSNKLHVTGSGSTPFATQRDVNSGGFAMLQGKMGDSASTTAGHAYSALVTGIEDNTNGAEDGYFAVEVSEGGSGSEKLRIKSNGNVGIGTTSPTSGAGWDKFVNISGGTSNAVVLDGTDSQQAGVGAVDGLYIDCVGHTTSSNNKIIFRTASSNSSYSGTERMRIASNGTVGIGNSSPSYLLDVKADADADTPLIRIRNESTGSSAASRLYMTANGNNFSLYNYGDGTGNANETRFRSSAGGSYFTFAPSSSEKVRIDSSGNLIVGDTAVPNGSNSCFSVSSGGTVTTSRAATNSQTHFLFMNPNGGVGSIRTNASATAFNTSSDARLKDVTGSARGLEVINALNPVAYNWKVDGKADEGLIAQEVLDIVPNAVSGSEEEYYQMDYSKLVTPLVKAIQEQQEQIEQLKAEIQTLKGE